ncbi:hypothetical protein D8682_00725 (plasmid) [Buttiauxella sp. 3AFRM03]|uniref:hypothetical protein n=1 Tax=Buttiauxella sp. 3AFRM03 TaxID=2479367 RepID=UPI000EF7FE00|nr:hypothetical protein [Buttiauxella sp. 3AFRM03]AYN25521.1 hypothetical protein D8682_00100 [Buttiauxella sp. 3AFRM03]AYN25632.1 hypothetical protein D8682_00725 [Buttiauxella sp. 3AFRM03]
MSDYTSMNQTLPRRQLVEYVMRATAAFCISLLTFNVFADPLPLQDLDAALQKLLDDDQRAFYGIPENIQVPKPNPKRKSLTAQVSHSLNKSNYLFPHTLNSQGEMESLKTTAQYLKPFSFGTTPIGPPWNFVKNITLIPLKINYASVGDSAIPDSIFRAKVQGYNCTEQTQTITGKITNTYKASRSSVLNSNIKSDSKFALGFPIGNTGATVGFEKAFSVGIGENITTNEEHTQSDEDEINQQVPAHVKRIYYLERIVKTGYYYFDGTVLADGDVSPNPSPESSDPFWGLLSQTLRKPEYKDPQRRTFHVSGYTWNASGFDKNYYWIDEPLTANQCSDLVKSIGKPFAAVPIVDNDSQEVVSPLFNGMLVETGNVTGTILVRAKSNSTLSCDVSFSTLSEQANVKAPPGEWSNWVPLIAHKSRVSYSVNYSINDNAQCSTSVEPQIKYMRSMTIQNPSPT